MLEPANLLKLAHALLGVMLVVGLVGRWITLGYATRIRELSALHHVLGVSARFERIVIVSSTLVLVLGIVTAIAQGRPLLGPLQGGSVDWLFASLVIFLSVLPLIPIVFLPRGRVFEAALADAEKQGEVVTDAVGSAMRDPVVYAAHVYELVAIATVLVLMIAKPF